MLPLKIVETSQGARVLDDRGHLVTSYPSKIEAIAFLAGYQTGRADAEAIVREHAEQLSQIGGR